MHVRKLALALGLVGILGAEIAAALGLGEIKLNSTLNQPLNAEIKLLQVRNLTPEEILVSLAARADFDRAGVERNFFLSDLRFKVLLDHPSGPLVRVTTRKPVREPYLNFILETQWPTGRLLREYTLLMDLPVFETAQPAPSPAAPPRSQRAPAAVPAPASPAPAAQPEYSQPQPAGRVSPSRSVDVYGPVASNDTLWEIALRVRPDRSVSVQQTMLALQRLNPGAFINDNINLLRRGQVLRVPSLEEIYSMSAQQAVAEVAQQNTQWSGDAGSRVTGPQLAGGRSPGSDPVVQRENEGRVKLGAPGNVEGAAGGRGVGAGDGNAEALQNELAITLEQLDKTERDNAELTSRIAELEGQIDTMERLVDVSQEELRALQLVSQQAEETAAATDTVAPAGGSPVDGTEQPVVDTTEVDSVVDTATDAGAPEAAMPAATPETSAAQPAPVEPKKVVRAAPKPKSFLDILMDNIIWVGAGLAAVIAAAFLLMRRRGEAEEDVDEAIDEFDNFDENVFAEEPAPAAVEEPQELALDNDVDTFDDVDDTVVAPRESEPVEAETSDVVGEADIYIAYGKFDQAEDMLRKVLVDNPARTDVRSKLLEVFSESNQLHKFDQEYVQLLTYNDAAANERAAELRGQIPDAGDFDPNAASAPDAFADDLEIAGDDGELSLELDLDDQPEQASDFDDLDLDLDLDSDLSSPDLSSDPGADLEADLSADLGTDLDSDALDISLDSDDLSPAAGEFDLELDLEEASSLDDSTVLEAADNPAGDDLSLDLDLTLDDLEAETAADAGEDLELGLPAEDDAGSGLEVLAQEDDSDGMNSFQDEFGSSLDEDLDSDDFDLDMSDVDMAALDQEVDALSAELDGQGDAKPAMEEPVTEFDMQEAEVTRLEPQAGVAANDPDESAEDDVFSEALASVPDQAEGADLSDENAELDFLADTDEAATKLDLARAYIDMGDKDGAKDILDEVAEEGNDQQRQEAQELLARM